MVKLGVSGLVAAALLSVAPAHATVMLASITGDYNDNPNWDYWDIELQYDTAYLTKVHTAQGPKYTWDVGSGKPSAIKYIKGVFYGRVPCDEPSWDGNCYDENGDELYRDPVEVHFSFNTFTSFEIDRTDWGEGYDNYTFSGDGPGFSFHQFGLYLKGESLRVDRPLNRSEYGHYASISGIGRVGGPHTEGLYIRRDPSAIPEPATWAMMIVGFGLTGLALRRPQREYRLV